MLAGMESLQRVKLVERVLMERMERKSRRVLKLWEDCNRNWNQVLFSMSAYAMGAPKNSAPFEELAGRVTYLMCLKERSSLRRVEALLLGVSGLLAKEFFDDYIVALQEEYDYLADKYSLESMHFGAWKRHSMLPAGNPVLRIVQLATLVSKEGYSMDALLRVKTLGDVEELFSMTPSDYWAKRCAPDGRGAMASGRIGRDKVNMLAINLVIPVQMAYAGVMGDASLRDGALALLEAIPAERNRLVGEWTGYGVPCESAYDSQALIELSTLCREGECARCPMEAARRRYGINETK